MKKYFVFLSLLFVLEAVTSTLKGQSYFPSKNNWQHQSAHVFGFDTVKLNDMIRFAKASESKNPRSMEQNHKNTFAREPFGEGIGPFKDRGDQTGLIIYKGYIVAQWGEPGRVDMTHSVTKSFLSTTVGLAVKQGLIKNTQDLVSKYMSTADRRYHDSIITLFNSEHNRKISWETMLRQTSDWEGTLWGKPDWADRPDKDSTKWYNRKRNEPGAVFEYNDVRVNAMALAATIVWKRPLPEVLKEYIMDPIGASDTWQWNGYRNSWVTINNKQVQSVSGGGHWGGGMFINAFDMARFGLLTLNNGNWDGKQLISQQWLQQSTTPTTANTAYGYMNFFLNRDKKYLPDAPEDAFVHVGNGTNIIYVDRANELVLVARWIENNSLNEIVKRLLAAKMK